MSVERSTGLTRKDGHHQQRLASGQPDSIALLAGNTSLDLESAGIKLIQIGLKRRGLAVGWDSPELSRKLASRRR